MCRFFLLYSGFPAFKICDRKAERLGVILQILINGNIALESVLMVRSQTIL